MSEWIVLWIVLGYALGVISQRQFSNTYRHWYLMCRNVLERTDSDEARNVLQKIGVRTSKREPWEDTERNLYRKDPERTGSWLKEKK
jgi:hypothetical protein